MIVKPNKHEEAPEDGVNEESLLETSSYISLIHENYLMCAIDRHAEPFVVVSLESTHISVYSCHVYKKMFGNTY